MNHDGAAPRIVIRRRHGGSEAFHGGAWKIALADFMTTLMALFLVLWVIATATPQQLRGLADYFNTPLAKAIMGGDRDSASDSVIPGGGPDPAYNQGEWAGAHLKAQSRLDQRHERMQTLRQRIVAAVDQDPSLRQLQNQLRFEMAPEGLRILLVDSAQRPMFRLGSDTLEPYALKLLQAMAPQLNTLPNHLSIYGYTDDLKYPTGDAGYSNWELSAGRANASRRALVAAGFDSDKLLTVTGVADRVPLAGALPGDPANRRIELVVLSTAEARRVAAGFDPPGPAPDAAPGVSAGAGRGAPAAAAGADVHVVPLEP